MTNNQIATPFSQDDNNLMQQLLQYWGLSEPILMGQYTRVQDKPFGFFNNVKNKAGKLLSYPQRLDEVSVYIYRDDLEEGAYYKFRFCLASLKESQNKNNRFLIQTDTSQEIIKLDYNQENKNNTDSNKLVIKTPKPKLENYKSWVQEIFDRKGKTEEDAKDIASSLNIFSEDLYTKAERFIFELLQNADDFPGASGKVQIKFMLLQEHLLILHTGKSFSKEEVEAICRIGNSTKSTDASKTGYKGIGFKSVFVHADCVYIFSGNYQFRYDKNYYKKPEITPWQIKPIWTDKHELPQEIRLAGDFFEYPVAIGVHVGIDKVNEYRQKIKEIFSEPRFMLFLRHVNLIEISGLVHDLKISLQLDRENKFSKISSNGKFRNNWLVEDFVFEVTQDVRDRVKNDNSVPTKLQQATKTKLSFGTKIENEKLIALSTDESVLFSYLPTNVKDYQFPLLVNADFLTKADREDLHRDNDWNCFIFEQIGYHIFEFLARICNSYPTYRNYITDLIPSPLNSKEKVSQSFNDGFAKGIENIAFIPSDETDKLLKVNEAIIDNTGITEIIPTSKVKSILNIQKCFVSRTLRNSDKLQRLGVETFDLNQLINLLKQYSYESLEEYIKIIIHLENKKYATKIKERQLPMIWGENGKIIVSTSEQTVYFQPSIESKKLLTFDNFAFILPQLDQDSYENTHLHSALTSLGVKDFNPIQVIKERMRKSQYEPIANTVNDHINHIRFIFQNRHQLTDIEYQRLSNLKLLYRIEEKYFPAVASSCYLSDYYQPQYALESVAKNLGENNKIANNFQFIASDYCEYEKDITSWRQFFLKINIVKPDGLEIIKKYILPLIDNNQINENNTIQITRFMFSVLHNQIINIDIKQKLSKLLLLTNEGLKQVIECNLSEFYINVSQSSNFLQEFKLPNRISNQYCSGNESPEKWRQFFVNIGVKEVNGIELIRKKIALLETNKDFINPKNVIQITIEIFNYNRDLTQDDFQKLSELPILVKNGQLAPANECYLSNDYHPKQDLESLFASTEFHKIVSSQYITENNAELWKQFFVKIQVAEELRVLKYEERVSFISTKDVEKAYLKYIQVDYADSYDMENFVEITDIEDYIQNYDFAYQLWSYLKQIWNINLEADSQIWISSDKRRKVFSYFKFLFTQYPSIPCIDKRCRKPAEIYSYSIPTKNDLIALGLPVSSIDFPSNIESFLGIKKTLDVKAYLQIIDNINANFSKNHIPKLLSAYEGLLKVLQSGNSGDKILISQWSKTGKLLGCDEQLHPTNELYYLDSSLELPYKQNPRLVKFPESLRSYNAENLLSAFHVKKIQNAPVYYDADKTCTILPQLIHDRLYYISVYLVNSTIPELIDEQTKKVIIALSQLSISNPNKLYRSIKDIDYEEAIYNFYGNNGIFYVGRWNSRKNAKIGEYLIKALGLDERKISSEKLLDFLDDPLEEVISYLREGGFDIPEPPKPEVIPPIETSITSSVISIDEPGKGYKPEQWGKFGEDKAELFYKRLGYTIVKQPDGTGYDFRCTKPNSELFVEVKTINPNYNDVIRITPNEWQKMCILDNQNKYELFIVLHVGESVTKMIRIQSAWKTLQEVLSKLNQQSHTAYGYNSNMIEVLIGLQGNSNNSGNDIIFNWKRLAEKGNLLSSNIQEFSS